MPGIDGFRLCEAVLLSSRSITFPGRSGVRVIIERQRRALARLLEEAVVAQDERCRRNG